MLTIHFICETRYKNTLQLRFNYCAFSRNTDQVLSFNNKEIIEAYKAAKKAGIYDKVMLYTGRTVRHYGLNNHKEYFAESTEAYLGVNDFYPFVRGELKEHDPRMYKIMEKVWGPVR